MATATTTSCRRRFRKRAYAGKVYVYLGSPGGLVKPAAFVATGENAGDDFGFSVAGAGDVNGDGFGDLIVGAHGYQTSTGRAYVYAGCAGGPQATAIFTATGEAANNHFGRSVNGAGDVNGDGLGDAAVGAYGVVGKAYVYHGDATVGVWRPRSNWRRLWAAAASSRPVGRHHRPRQERGCGGLLLHRHQHRQRALNRHS